VAEVRSIDLLAVRGAETATRADPVAVEEPLEIRAEGPGDAAVSIAVTMRTPGHDTELAAGFLFTEGLIKSRDDLATPAVRELAVEGSANNVVTVRLARAFDPTPLKRNFYATSSCGICGKASIDHLHAEAPPITSGITIARSTIAKLPERMREAQRAFDRTGGIHATAVFDRDGALVCVREDVGRHNAMDKAIGRALLDRHYSESAARTSCDRKTPLADRVLLVSGRASFELVQKAAMAGAPILCAVSAPSSLAVQAAQRLGITLVGFVRGDGFNVYAHPDRVDLGA
jgi:FdhD protein